MNLRRYAAGISEFDIQTRYDAASFAGRMTAASSGALLPQTIEQTRILMAVAPQIVSAPIGAGVAIALGLDAKYGLWC